MISALVEVRTLAEILDRIRTFAVIREKSPGVFYVRSTPFLNFHLKDGQRWADARCGAGWGPKLDIPLDSTAGEKARFLAEVTRYHEQTRLAVVRPPGAPRGERAAT